MSLAAVRRQTVFIKIKENNILVKRKDGKSRNWNKRTNIEKNKMNDNGDGNTMLVLRVKNQHIKSDEEGSIRPVYVTWIESRICKKQFDPLDPTLIRYYWLTRRKNDSIE